MFLRESIVLSSLLGSVFLTVAVPPPSIRNANQLPQYPNPRGKRLDLSGLGIDLNTYSEHKKIPLSFLTRPINKGGSV